jgi:hypothetical protein
MKGPQRNDDPAEIRTKYQPNTSQEHYSYTRPLDLHVLRFSGSDDANFRCFELKCRLRGYEDFYLLG